ncbi:MAG: Mrp/NBP35 family ATP-binding protein [Oscillospiraceae bacterium]|nr:Mrp/NBP35 family ATP-binding protein [Oscillospiraceae bacterium]
MSECNSESCSSCAQSGTCGEPKNTVPNFSVPAHELSQIKNVIAVMSGKGGVGKSFVTSSLAVAMAKQGKKVGILDADITGPSIPTAFGLHTQAYTDDNGILPVASKGGIKVISLNLLMPNETDPVIWRGPVIAGVVKQFWGDVIWGELDYLFVDMPPGTGDVPLTVFQSLPVNGIVMVTSPQDLVRKIVAKAVNMAKLMRVPLLGLVENFSYFVCPDCGGRHEIFGPSTLDKVAEEFAIPVLGRVPIDPRFSGYCDRGEIEDISPNQLEAVAALLESATS